VTSTAASSELSDAPSTFRGVLPALARGHYTLDAFRYRGDRFLFARRRTAETTSEDPSPGELVYLEQGEAHQMRETARTQLRCPEPDCTTPEITTVSRSTGGARDGYRHLRRPETGAHAPESVMHRQAKALVARWATDHPAVARVEVEAAVGGGERIADVLLTSTTGNRLAVEVQFASLSLETYLERTRSYASHGVAVVWLWGNCGPHSPRMGAINLLHQHAVRDGRPLLWIHPADEVVAWAHATARSSSARARAAEPEPTRGLLPTDDRYDVAFGGLDDLDLRATGLFPPGWAQLRLEAREHAHGLALAIELEYRAVAERAAAAAARRSSTWSTGSRASTFSQWERQESRRAIAPGVPRCTRCGLPLDPVLWTSGRHVGDCTRLD
jgi:hypothetical protein